MFTKLGSGKRSESGGPLSLNSGQQASTSATREREVPMDTQESNGKGPTSNVATASPNEIITQDRIYSVAFLADGEHVVSGGWEMKIRQWRIGDGKEVKRPMDAGSVTRNLAVTQDGKWIACGTKSGQVIVWDAKSHRKVINFKAHDGPVNALDFSANGTRIATGSDDSTLRVWSFPTGKQLLGPFKHDYYVLAVKFSLDMRLIATATWRWDSVRIYDSGSGDLLADFPIRVNSGYNGSLAWASDSNRLFVLSSEGNIHCLNVSARKTLAKWCIHSQDKPRCIAVCNDTIIAASANSSLSLWDSKTQQQIGSVFHHSHNIESMAISPRYDIATTGNKSITLRNLYDILPSPYLDNMRLEQEIRYWKAEKNELEAMVQSLRARNSYRKDDIAYLEKTVEELRSQLAISNEEKTGLNEMIKHLRAEKKTSDRKIIHLSESDKQLRSVLAVSKGSVDQLTQTISTLRTDVDLREKSSVCILQKINELEISAQELSSQFATCECALRIHDKKHVCETLYAGGHIYDAARHIANAMTEGLWHEELDWLNKLLHRCVSRLQTIGDAASSSGNNDEALSAYSTVLSLTPSPPEGVLVRWAKMALLRCSPNEALSTAEKFKLPMFHVYRAVCNVLEGDNRLMEAMECFRKLQIELSEETGILYERLQWELDFRQRCSEKLERGGDAAIGAKNHDVAIGYYSIALLLHPTNVSCIIVKCCKARVGLLEAELVNVTQITERDQLNYKSYKRKHAILHSLGRYKEAFDAFKMMLSRMENSHDPRVRDMRGHYLDTTPLIRQIVEQTIHDTPRALINTTTGRLYDKAMQAAAFEQLPIFNQLRSFMTTHDRLDRARIQREVERFYEYVMFSHRWQSSEPSFQMIENALIYGLPTSPTVDKLINFCKLVQSRHFRWAWSDTCCVNQSDKGIQQESVVAMFQWYCHAALTIVHLVGVFSATQEPGSLWKSIWNTRGWTYQEYVASRVVQFYTEDWKPYLGLETFNHKESPIVLAEMEQATMFATQALATLQPGLTRVREKLYLASKRQTTRKEDIAYCLFGIFDVALPVIYGEGMRAVGRLLEHILTRSDNVTILAWTGISGGNHSYLPLDLTVYDQVVPPHIPQPIEITQIDGVLKALQLSLPDPSLPPQLYEQLYNLPPLSLVAGRLRLSGLVFPLNEVERLPGHDDSDVRISVYRAISPVLGDLRIETKDNLVGMEGLVLIHPWISSLIDEDFSGITPQFDLAARALRLVARLRQPFGGLLLASQSRVQYKRVATDSFIKLQIRAETPLEELMDSVRTVDVQ